MARKTYRYSAEAGEVVEVQPRERVDGVVMDPKRWREDGFTVWTADPWDPAFEHHHDDPTKLEYGQPVISTPKDVDRALEKAKRLGGNLSYGEW